MNQEHFNLSLEVQAEVSQTSCSARILSQAVNSVGVSCKVQDAELCPLGKASLEVWFCGYRDVSSHYNLVW